METDQSCPLCKTSRSKVIFRRGNYSVIECVGCSFARLNKVIAPEGAKKFYSESYFDDKRNSAYFADAKRKLQFVKNFVQPPAFLLDFGCGLGHFLKISKDVGFDVVGYDVSDYAVSFVKETYSVKAYSEPLEKVPSFKNAFDVAASWDVIEHVPNFMKMLKILRRTLKRGGFLFLTTPNSKALEARLSGKHWYGYTKIPEHVNFFSPSNNIRADSVMKQRIKCFAPLSKKV